MKKIISAISLMLAIMFTASSQVGKGSKSTIVIIPGSWSSPADWGYVVPQIKSAGYEVIVVNLPGHGTDKTPIASVTLQSYVDAVKKAIGKKTHITLVAHSFGGVVANQVAEDINSQIKEIVYLAAYVPKNGESLLTLATSDGDSHLGKVLQIKEKEGIAVVPTESIIDVFFADAPKQVQDYASAHFPVEPLAPLATPVKLTEGKYGTVKKVYIFTEYDHVNSPALQHKMATDNQITKTYSIPSSHTAFVSMPDVVAGIINNEAK